ncbi:hypothetical protein [Streptomyces sp. HUAS TT7]|uniref:hypothetical protein n=1 Tax=Streptomyces sp. HUAS TT7 TaxID=3447507 RepID=UPI003F65D19B
MPTTRVHRDTRTVPKTGALRYLDRTPYEAEQVLALPALALHGVAATIEAGTREPSGFAESCGGPTANPPPFVRS